MQKKHENGFVTFFKSNMGILIALIVMCVFLSVFPLTSSTFFSIRNATNVLRQIATNVFLACGMCFVLLLGGIDLSVGAVIALSGCVSAGCVSHLGMSVPLALLVGVLIGLACGVFNGIWAMKTTIPPFIITLASQDICKGIAYVYTGGSPVRVVTKQWQWLGAGYVGVLPIPVIVTVIVLVLTGILLNKTKFGRYMYAVGGNIQAAKFSGINVPKVQFFVYLYSGLMAGLAGIVMASRLYSGQPTAGDGSEMDAIAACVVGGISMAGGSGKLGGVIIGALIIGVLNNGLNLMNVNSFWQYIVKGCVILLAVYVDWLRGLKRKAAK